MTGLEAALVVAASFCGGWLGAAVRDRRDRARAARQATLDHFFSSRGGWDGHVDAALAPWERPS